MSYSPTTWVDGTTALNQTHLNNLETQYTEASQSLERDLFTAFVFSGLVCTKDGTTVNQLDVTSGVAFLLQSSDSTLRRRATSASIAGQFTTATPSTTYYLDLNPDGTFNWGTAHSGQSNYLPICQVATDASGNISTVTDKRTLSTTLLGSMAGGNLNLSVPFFPTNVHIQGTLYGASGILTIGDKLSLDGGNITSDGAGHLTALAFHGNADSATTAANLYGSGSGDGLTVYDDGTEIILRFGANPLNRGLRLQGWVNSGGYYTPLVGFDNQGNFWTLTNRNGTGTLVLLYSGTNTPSGDGVTTPPTGAWWAKA